MRVTKMDLSKVSLTLLACLSPPALLYLMHGEAQARSESSLYRLLNLETGSNAPLPSSANVTHTQPSQIGYLSKEKYTKNQICL